ncbi:DNA polymerase III subunit theta [Providencia sp. AGC89]
MFPPCYTRFIIPAQKTIDVEVERQQPEHLREYFRERLVYYRELSKRLPKGYEYNQES